MATRCFAGELPDFKNIEIKGLTHTAIGVTRRDTPIAAYVCSEDTNYSTKKCRILLIGGLDGERKSVDAVLETLKWFQTHEDAGAYRELMALSAVPCANPDGVLLDKGGENTPFPPEGKRYLSEQHVEAQYLWFWLQLHAPDIVLEVRQGKAQQWHAPQASDSPWHKRLADDKRFGPFKDTQPKELITALRAADVPALRVTLVGDDQTPIHQFLHRQALGLIPYPSGARQRIVERLETPAKDVVQNIFVRQFKKPLGRNYYETLPILALHRMTRRRFEVSGEVKPPAVPVTEEQVPRSGSELAGTIYLIGQPYDARTIVSEAANLSLDKDGKPLAEPPFHNQMSDAVFMNGPVLAGAGAHTKERKYFEACAQHVQFTLKLCKRDDGLYRHSPLNEAAWGRGNGFVAMGLALVLEEFDPKHPAYPELLKAYQEHLAVLKRHQDYTGCWHQVIDHPESYREFTCTCMIGFAMATGVRHGWLKKEEYQSCVDKAWEAARVRVVDDRFLDVCTGTGKQKTLRDYFDREALFGHDDRAASIFLMFASER